MVNIDDKAKQVEFSEIVGISPQRVSELVRKGRLEKGASYRRWLNQYCASLREIAAGRAAEDGGEKLDLVEERAKLARAQCEAQELKNAIARQEVAPTSIITWTLSNVCAQINAILGSATLNLKRQIPRLTATELETIKREIVKAQNAAAEVNVNFDEYAEPTESS